MAKIGEFNVATGNWQLYCDRLESYFKVNDVKNELKLPSLIAFMGDPAYELLSNLCSPKKPADMTFDEVTKVMKNHLQPTPSILAERYKFRQRRQQPGETISDYVAELKRLTKFCNFNTNLEESLRDQLACGVRSETIRQRLFADGNISFRMAVATASAMEAAERDAAVVDVTWPTGENQAAAAGYDWRLNQGDDARTSARRSTMHVNRLQLTGCRACGDSRHTPSRGGVMAGRGGGGVRFVHGTSRGAGAGARGAGRMIIRGSGAGGGGGAGRNRGWRSGSTQSMHAVEAQSQEDDDIIGDLFGHSSEDSTEEALYQMSLSGYKPVQ